VAIAEALRGTGTMIFVIIFCVFSAVAFMYLIIAVLKYGRNYEDKLKELKELKELKKE